MRERRAGDGNLALRSLRYGNLSAGLFKAQRTHGMFREGLIVTCGRLGTRFAILEKSKGTYITHSRRYAGEKNAFPPSDAHCPFTLQIPVLLRTLPT